MNKNTCNIVVNIHKLTPPINKTDQSCKGRWSVFCPWKDEGSVSSFPLHHKKDAFHKMSSQGATLFTESSFVLSELVVMKIINFLYPPY